MRPQDNIHVGRWNNDLAPNFFSSSLLTVPDVWGIVVFSALAILVYPTLSAVVCGRESAAVSGFRKLLLTDAQVTHISQKSWSIEKFIAFCVFAPFPERELGEYLVLLRNNPTAFSTSWKFSKLVCKHSWSRNRRHRRLTRRQTRFIWSIILLGLVHTASFLSLGAFLPFGLIDTLAKLRNVNCGYYPVNISDLESIANEDTRRFVFSQYAGFVASGAATTAGYVSECYGPSQLSSCDLLVHSKIPWTGLDNTSCPFAPGQCIGGGSSAYTMIMRNITAAYYGINIKSSLTMSRESTCAPIIMDPYQCDDEHGNHGFCHFTYNGKNHSTPVRMDEANASMAGSPSEISPCILISKSRLEMYP
ncbi:hypothetical protein BKA64DRAFT_238174 [Cadophora sp. MPI-SDFR-AT-0126]|nr:hypothetical protein BKA64DRAFT_238174 [Leotiomycetes sp. MPI-SDFR-AT-0126]